MKSYLFILDCITNLHVGSGDINFNIVDKEVEKDPITLLPIIHASGLKGAIKDYCKEKVNDNDKIDYWFGKKSAQNDGDNGGALKFTDAGLVYRMMRASGNRASVGVTTREALEQYIETATAFGCKPTEWKDVNLSGLSFNGNFLCSEKDLKIEGDTTVEINNDEIKTILGTDAYGIAKSMKDYDLPVIARNNLDPNNRNLWYEEFVPHGSHFWFVLLAPDDADVVDVLDGKMIQFGGNASVGCGFCRLTKCGEGEL